MRKLVGNNYIDHVNIEGYKTIVLGTALRMGESDKTFMHFDDLINKHRVISRIIYRRKQEENLKFYYPKAFLLNGLTDYAVSNNDSLLMQKITYIIKNYLKDDGHLAFEMDKVDQAVFGLSLISLQQHTDNPFYLKAINDIFRFLKTKVNTDYNIILYRDNQHIQLCDALGMICPFLIKYGTVYKDSIALKMAYNQINYYIKYGLDLETHLPFHAVDLQKNIRLGPVNWGRGVGWYLISLAYAIHYTDEDVNPYYSMYCYEMDLLFEKLMELRINNYWGQFISGDTSDSIDTSTTTLLLYAFGLANYINYQDEEIVKIFSAFTNTKGFLDFTSGDTQDINKYSNEFGVSELSQGMLLSIFSISD